MENYIHICEICGKQFNLRNGEGLGESYISDGAMLPKSRYVCIECFRKERK